MTLLPLILLAGSPKNEHIAALEAQVAALQAQLEACQAARDELTRATPGTGSPASPGSEAEAAASALLTQANEAVTAGDFPTAKAKLAEVLVRFPSTRAATGAERLLQEIEIVGSQAPPLEIERWYQGNGDLRSGRVVLLVFFETWCPHCVNATPGLVERYSRFHPEGLEIIGVTRVTKTSSDETVQAYIHDNAVPYPIAHDTGSATSDAYKVGGIPAAAAVRDGVVIWRGHPARLTDEQIAGWLAG